MRRRVAILLLCMAAASGLFHIPFANSAPTASSRRVSTSRTIWLPIVMRPLRTATPTPAPNGAPAIRWSVACGNVIVRYSYVGGILVGFEAYPCFENTGSSGTVEFTAAVPSDRLSGVFHVESGGTHKLIIGGSIGGRSHGYPTYHRRLEVTSRLASSAWETTLSLNCDVSSPSIDLRTMELEPS